jgi:hypothetical protein
MLFNQHTDGWFDAIAEFGKVHEEQGRELALIARLKPSKRNVLRFKNTLDKIRDPYMPGESRHDLRFATALVLLSEHCNVVLQKGFKKEFRYSFGEITAAQSFRTNFRKVSAASELFSMARQALSYSWH